ncbi:DMT family transporter [Nocardioides jiangxiensis]|uniref:DMT family transporter n=1 Tax=Nocardioides jiangxiensis TaxID=3064524 RepID=A0ABT9B3L1_9ACTN|nr:DMT family transporter [Nocardioides sp. WY-20]MDO7869434.1 DMT family transporter [Nocardioides sp. WY-20]
MLVVVLALGGAAAYGVADFVGGLLSRRTSAWAVAFTAALGAGVLAVLAAPFLPGSPTAHDLWWGAAGGVGAGVGTGFLYRGLAAGRMGVVAPISGVGAAVVPVLVALALGERPDLLVWVGVACALPGIWLVARDPRGPASGGAAAGVLDGLLAGLGFGAQFAALGQIQEGAGYLPLGVNQLVGAAVVAALALGTRAAWAPRDRAAYGGVVSGLLGLAATAAFTVAAQRGSLTVPAILTSLYPAFTILLAAIVLRERILRDQALGLALCGAAVVLVAAG